MLACEGGVARFKKSAIKARVVTDNQTHHVHDSRDTGLVDPLPADHVIADAGQTRDFRRYGCLRVFQAFIPIDDAKEAACLAPVFAGRDGKVNDPVTELWFQPGGFGIDDSESTQGSPWSFRRRPHESTSHAGRSAETHCR